MGETTLFAVDAAENILANLQLTVNHNLSRLENSFRQMLPGTRVQVASVDGGLVLHGSVDSALDAENAKRIAERFAPEEGEVINRLAVTGPNQIHLRVRVAEVSRQVIKAFGINWDAVTNKADFLFGLSTGNPVVAPDANGIANFSSTVFNLRNAGPRGTQTNSLFGKFTDSDSNVNGLLDALDDEGLISILAEPNLTAMSGQSANFLAGGEFPIPVPQDNGRITIEFKKFGVGLAFTPTLVGKRISLRVRPEVSQISNTGAIIINGFNIPALTTRRAETTVELGSGQSFAIAGLLQNNSSHDISKFPGLGDVPVLGSLFRSNQFIKDESELVIIVTPYLVRPVSAPQMATPTDGLIQPSDYERLVESHTYRRQPLPQASATGALGDGGLGDPSDLSSSRRGRMKHENSARHSTGGLMVRGAILGSVLGLLMACIPPPPIPEDVQPGPPPPKELRVERNTYVHQVAFNAASDVLSDAEAARLDGFLMKHEAQYAGHTFVESPRIPDDAELAARRQAAVLSHLRRRDVQNAPMPDDRTAVTPTGRVSVVLTRYVAIAPPCPDWSKFPGQDFLNQTASNFGCANVTNFGAMLADPGDLVSGRQPGPTDGEAAALAIETYRAGEVTEIEESDTSSSEVEFE